MIFSHSSGRTSVSPYTIIMIAENVTRNPCGTPISKLDAFKTIVKNVMKNHVESTMTNGLYRFCVPILDQRIIGNTGNTHGASTLNIPARNERIIKGIEKI